MPLLAISHAKRVENVYGVWKAVKRINENGILGVIGVK